MAADGEPGDGERGDGSWLLEPTTAHHVHLHVAVGEGAEFSASAQAAFDTFLRELYASEIEASVLHCPELRACKVFACSPLGKCRLSTMPCLADVICFIG